MANKELKEYFTVMFARILKSITIVKEPVAAYLNLML